VSKFKKLIKLSRSRSSSFNDEVDSQLADKVQDAVETPVTSSPLIMPSNDAVLTPIQDGSVAVGAVSSELLSKIEHLSTDEENKASSHQETKETKQETHPTPVQEQPSPSQEQVEEEDAEGYQVCSMETGMCYWVPAKKFKANPSPFSSRSRTPPSLIKDLPPGVVDLGASNEANNSSVTTPGASNAIDTSVHKPVGKLSKNRLALFETSG